jgi:PST family polysaccharide transporter
MFFLNDFKKNIKKYIKLIENFSYLLLLQIFNLIYPLLVFPYLISTLGKEIYGLVVYAQAVIGYLVILVNFGFDFSAAKEVSINRDKKKKLNIIINSVFIIKFFLLLIAFCILFIILAIIKENKNIELLFVLTMWMCLADILLPTWYFQGIEDMKYITIITTISRILFVFLIFIFVKVKEDYLLIPIINGIGAMIAGIYANYIIYVRNGNKFFIPKVFFLKRTFLNSFPLFLSNLSLKLYISSNKVITGTFLGMTEVSYYDLAEKITSILKMPQNILGRVLLPKVSYDKNYLFLKKTFKYSLILNLLIYSIFYFAINPIIYYLGKGDMNISVIVTRILLLTVPIIGISNYYGIQLLIPLGYYRHFSKIIILSSIFYLLQIILIWKLNMISIFTISIITVITEVFVALGMFISYKHVKAFTPKE